MLRHADGLIHLDRLAEQRARLVCIAGLAAIDQHPGVPAPDFWLRDLVWERVCLPERLLVGFQQLTEEFDRALSTKLRVVGEKDLAHAALAETIENAVTQWQVAYWLQALVRRRT